MLSQPEGAAAVCGVTEWRSWDECRAGEPKGGINIENGGVGGAPITSLEECISVCKQQCPEMCKYVAGLRIGLAPILWG
jgi:hypothetical protein